MKRAAATMQEPVAKAKSKIRTLVEKERLMDCPFALLILQHYGYFLVTLYQQDYMVVKWDSSFLHPHEATETA